MEDGAPVYCSKASKEWRKLCLIEKFDWLANSLDLNPLENVWKLLKDAVQHGQICPRNLEELMKGSEDQLVVLGFVIYVILCLLRLQSMIEAKRGHTYL
jgi:hypothetical protein